MVKLARHDCENIHRNVLRILAKVGASIEHPKLLEALALEELTSDEEAALRAVIGRGA
jgi:trimethylamine:corrinoid methyltransferase-like protein